MRSFLVPAAALLLSVGLASATDPAATLTSALQAAQAQLDMDYAAANKAAGSGLRSAQASAQARYAAAVTAARAAYAAAIAHPAPTVASPVIVPVVPPPVATPPATNVGIPSNTTLSVFGMSMMTQSASKPYSLTAEGAGLRFEIHKGDNDPDFDPAYGKERSEVFSPAHYPFGQDVAAEYDVMVDPGPVTDREWLIIGQWHGDDTAIGSPTLSIDVQPTSDRKGEVLRANSDTDSARYRSFPSLTPFVRGTWHHVRIALTDAHGLPNGRLHVEWDGKVILDKPQIATGFASAKVGSYWKVGVYAATAVQPSDTGVVVHVKNLTVTPYFAN